MRPIDWSHGTGSALAQQMNEVRRIIEVVRDRDRHYVPVEDTCDAIIELLTQDEPPLVQPSPERFMNRIRNHKCPNCGGEGPHFVPPSMGDPGFYICVANDDPHPPIPRKDR